MDTLAAFIEGYVGELQAADYTADGLPVPQNFLERVRTDDETPMFVVAEVESGVSKSGRRWRPEHLKKVVDAVNSRTLGGVLGHPLLRDPKAIDYEFPKPQVLWVVADLKDKGSKAVARFKGYVLKGAEAREYLKPHLKMIDGVSIFGDTTMRRGSDGVYDVVDFEPQSIDFAPKGRSGMPSRILALAGEMTEGSEKVEPKDIAALSETELRAHNPLLVEKIERDTGATFATKIGEMEATVTSLQPQVDLLTKVREALGLAEGDNIIEKLENVMKTLEDQASGALRDFVQTLIAKKAKTERAQGILKRLLGEMAESGYAFSSKFKDRPLNDSLKTEIETALDKKIEEDDGIKAVVGEMIVEDNAGGNRGTQGGSSLGSRSGIDSRGEGTATRTDGIVMQNERITVRKQKLSV